MRWTPDSSFYPSPRMAMKAPVEKFAYVATFDPAAKSPDALAIVDVDPKSKTYSKITGTVKMSNKGDELHHFGWNACSSALCPYAHPQLERRYLLVPGLRSSRVYVLDTQPDPRQPRLARVIEADEVLRRAGYSRLHTVHCGPDAIYLSALGSAEGGRPGGILLLDL